MNAIPPDLRAAIDRHLAEALPGSLVGKTARMSENYRQGGGSGGALDLGAIWWGTAGHRCRRASPTEPPDGGRNFAPDLADAGSAPGTAARGGDFRLFRCPVPHFWTTIRSS